MLRGTEDENESSEFYSLIKTYPAVKDPRELQTIITNSLRSMFGDCHSHIFHVVECRPLKGDTDSYVAIIQTPSSSLNYVRASLCFVQPPSHLQDNIYRFDFIETQKSLADLK
jgi:RNase P/RNase MRP subunit POP5